LSLKMHPFKYTIFVYVKPYGISLLHRLPSETAV